MKRGLWKQKVKEKKDSSEARIKWNEWIKRMRHSEGGGEARVKLEVRVRQW